MSEENDKCARIVDQILSKSKLPTVECLLCGEKTAEKIHLIVDKKSGLYQDTYDCKKCGYYRLEEALLESSFFSSQFQTQKNEIQRIIGKLNKEVPPFRPLIGKKTNWDNEVISIRDLITKYGDLAE